MTLLGAANLVPWMTFLSLADYFSTLYHSNLMEFYFPAVSTTALVLTSVIMLVVGQHMSFEVRVAWSTVVMTLCMTVVPIVDLLLSAGLVNINMGIAFTLCAVLLNAIFSAVAQSSLYALGALLGEEYTQAMQTGNGLIGLAAVGIRVATKLGLPPTPAMQTFCTVGILILGSSLVGFYALLRDPHVSKRIECHEQRRGVQACAS